MKKIRLRYAAVGLFSGFLMGIVVGIGFVVVKAISRVLEVVGQ